MGGPELPDDIDDLAELFGAEGEYDAQELKEYKVTVNYIDRESEEIICHEFHVEDNLVMAKVLDDIVEHDGPMIAKHASPEFVPAKAINIDSIRDIDFQINDRMAVHPDDYGPGNPEEQSGEGSEYHMHHEGGGDDGD
mgnify:CR=1 FL=1